MALEKHWAMEAWLASANYIEAIADKSVYTNLGTVGVLHHGLCKGVPFEIEFVAFNREPHVVVEAIKAYNSVASKKFSVTIFHASPNTEWLVAQYALLGYKYESHNAILGVKLPTSIAVTDIPVTEVKTEADIELVNAASGTNDQLIPASSVGDPHIHHFFAEIDGQVVGWTQMVTVVPRIAYLSAMFTISQFRRRGVARALLNRVHTKALADGSERVLLIPSDMAQNYYPKLGYQPLIYLTVFQPTRQI